MAETEHDDVRAAGLRAYLERLVERGVLDDECLLDDLERDDPLIAEAARLIRRHEGPRRDATWMPSLDLRSIASGSGSTPGSPPAG